MTVTFFGTAGAVHSAEDGNVSLLVQEGRITVLVDASGAPAQSLRRCGVDPAELDVLVLTHAHPDHIYALPSLLHNLWLLGRSKPLTVLANTATAEAVRLLAGQFRLLDREGLFPLEWRVQGERTSARLPGLAVLLFPVQHSVPCSGVSLTGSSRLVYGCDTGPARTVVEEARGARALIHEASGVAAREEHLNADGHSSARQAGRAAREAGVGTLFLCHFDYRQPAEPQELAAEARTAFDGQVVVPRLFEPYEL